MVIHFELHPSWTQSLLFGDALKAGVSLGKDNYWIESSSVTLKTPP